MEYGNIRHEAILSRNDLVRDPGRIVEDCGLLEVRGCNLFVFVFLIQALLFTQGVKSVK